MDLHHDGPWHPLLNEVRLQLKRHMDGVVAQSMRDKGISYGINFGVKLPFLTEIAQTLPRDCELAETMWRKEVREMKILATMIYPWEQLREARAYILCCESPYVEISEQLCRNLLVNTPFVELLTIRLWQNDGAAEAQTTVIPYILMTRLLIHQKLGYELRPLLLDYAARDSQKGGVTLPLYIINAITRLHDSSPEGARRVTTWLRGETLDDSPVMAYLRRTLLETS